MGKKRKGTWWLREPGVESRQKRLPRKAAFSFPEEVEKWELMRRSARVRECQERQASNPMEDPRTSSPPTRKSPCTIKLLGRTRPRTQGMPNQNASSGKHSCVLLQVTWLANAREKARRPINRGAGDESLRPLLHRLHHLHHHHHHLPLHHHHHHPHLHLHLLVHRRFHTVR